MQNRLAKMMIFHWIFQTNPPLRAAIFHFYVKLSNAVIRWPYWMNQSLHPSASSRATSSGAVVLIVLRKTSCFIRQDGYQEKKNRRPSRGSRKAKRSRNKRVFGIYQSSKPGYTCTWNRDVNAAINIVNNFRTLHETGDVPLEFRRGIKLVSPPSSRYRDVWNSKKNNFTRTCIVDNEESL